MDDQPEVVKRAEFARMIGVSRAAVTQAIGKGRIGGTALTEDGRVVVAEALKQWRANTLPRADVVLPAAAGQADDEGEDQADPYHVARTQAALLEVQKRQLELDRMRGLYRPVAEMEDAMAAAGLIIAQAMDRLVLMAEELAGLGGDVGAVRALIQAKVRELRQLIADQLTADAAAGDDP